MVGMNIEYESNGVMYFGALLKGVCSMSALSSRRRPADLFPLETAASRSQMETSPSAPPERRLHLSHQP